MIEALESASRLVVRAKLSPTLGSTFQPTGFPDLGPAEFDRPLRANGELTVRRALLVESVQSMANRFEEVGWDGPAQRPVTAIERLPYLEVRSTDGEFLSSSRLEPHRLAGAYVKDASIDGNEAGKWMVERLGVKTGVPLDWPAIYAGVFELDPLCLVHGVFFSDPEWSAFGNPKVRRAISASIEAHDVQAAVSGGVKRDDVRPEVGEGRGAKEGYGFVPFGRTEYTAAEIVLSAVVDLSQIRGYGLSAERTQLVALICLWELSSLLGSPLRPRTACDLEVLEIEVSRPDGFELPSPTDLADAIQRLDPQVEQPGARTATWGG